MATFLDSEHMTLAEVMQLSRKGSENPAFMKPLMKRSKLMQILPWYPTDNGTDVHHGTRAVSAPEGGFVSFNSPTPKGKTATEAYEEPIKMFELSSDVDTRIINRYGSQEQRDRVRSNKDLLNFKGYMNSLAKNIVSCDGTDPESVKGLLARRPKLDDVTTFSLGATSSNKKIGSILLIKPGEDGVNLRYNEGNGGPCHIEDKGILNVNVYDSDGKVIGDYDAARTTWYTNFGIDVASNDALIRIANVPLDTEMTKAQMHQLIDVVNSLDELDRYVALCPEELRAQFWKYLEDKSNITFTQTEIEGIGAPIRLLNVPLFIDDYLLNNESVLA